jgi:hypothetical protein
MFAVIRVLLKQIKILMSLVFMYLYYPKKCFIAHVDELKFDIIGSNWKERKYGKFNY